MSALGQKQTYAVQNGMSALPPKADIGASCPLRANCGVRPARQCRFLYQEDPDQLCSLASFEIAKLGFDEPGKGKNFRPRPSHPDLFQNRLELLTKWLKASLDCQTSITRQPP